MGGGGGLGGGGWGGCIVPESLCPHGAPPVNIKGLRKGGGSKMPCSLVKKAKALAISQASRGPDEGQQFESLAEKLK